MPGWSRRQEKLQARIADIARDASRLGRAIRIMEVCGTHTVAIHRAGLRGLLPDGIKLISGPGCPVCVTAAGYIDALVSAAGRAGTTIATYGDMVRVPGTKYSLADMRADGAEVVVVNSAFQAYTLARQQPDREVIFAAVGFETTAPASADIAIRARATHVDNLSLLCAHKLVIPAIKAVLSDPQCAIDAFLCPGHVSVIIGSDAYEPIARQYGRPCVVAGFEPGQIVEGVARIVSQLADNKAVVENAYPQAVAEQPHSRALEMLETVFTPAKTQWRAMGEIADSGLVLNDEFGSLDAATRFGLSTEGSAEPAGCRCGDVIRGRIDPPECSLFGTTCTTGNPIGPCMVSSEGACQAWLKYGEL